MSQSHVKFTYDRQTGASHMGRTQPELTEQKLANYQNQIFQKENQVDSMALQQYLNRVRTTKISKQNILSQKTQINYIITNVFNLLKKMMILPQNQNSFTKILSVYAQLIKSRQNGRYHYGVIEDHLKDVLSIDVHRKNKKLYMFIAKVFQFNPYTVYKILQSKPQFLQWNSQQSLKIYNLFIRYASQKKNISLILKQIKKCIEKQPHELQRLKILLTYFPQTINEALIMSIYNYINRLIQRQFRTPSLKKQLQINLLDIIKLFVSLPWPQDIQINKDQVIISYLNNQIWKSSNCSKQIRHILNDILLKLDVNQQTIQWMRKEITKRLKQFDTDSRQKTQSFRAIKIMLAKIKKDEIQEFLTKEQVQNIVSKCLQFPLKQELVSLLQQIKQLKIYSLGKIIHQKLKARIQSILGKENISITRQRSHSTKQQFQNAYFTPEDKKLALKALRRFKFDSSQVYLILKQHVLKNQLNNKSQQIKKQVIKACLYCITYSSGILDKMKIMTSILNLINKQPELKILTVNWLRENEASYDKKIFEVFKQPQYLHTLFQDYASNHMIMKRFSIKVLCFIYPLGQCQIVPFLKRVYYQIYDRLSSDNIVSFEEKKEALRLTREILRHRTQIIYDDASALCNFLYNHLHRAQQYEQVEFNQILIQIFKTIVDLIRKIPKNVLPYANPISDYIIKLLNSKDSQQKVKTCALNCFNQLIRNCSYVLIPYFHFKNLFQIIREIFREGARGIDHEQILCLLGNLGFTSKEKYDRLRALTSNTFDSKQINRAFEKIYKQTSYIRQVKNQRQINPIENSGWNGPFLFTKEQTTYTYIEIANFKKYILFKINKILSEHPSKTVSCMVFRVLQSLTPILNKQQQKMFQNTVFAQILKPEILKQSHTNVFSLVSKIVKFQNTNQNSNLILNYLISLFDDKRFAQILRLIELIYIITLNFCQNQNKDDSIVRKIVSKITQYISRPNIKVTQIKIGLKIIENLAECTDNLIHLFLPQFNKLFLCSNPDICICYFEVLLELCKKAESTQFYLPPITQSLIQLLKLQIEKHNKSGTPNSLFIQKIIDFVLCMMLIYEDRFKGYITQFKKIIGQFQPRHLLFSIAEDYMKKHCTLSYLQDAFQPYQINQLQKKRINLGIAISNKSQNVQRPFIYKKVIFAVIQQFNCEKNQIQDESQEWFTKICISIFQKSSQLFVHQCGPLVKQDRAFCYDIFPVAFYFFWNSLCQQGKKKLTNKIKIILQSKVISLGVKQKFLDTIYFMDQWKVPIPLKYKFLREVSTSVLDSAKALFYLQSLFQKQPQVYGQQLIEMYAELQQKQSAIGLLKIVQNLNTKTKIKLNQKLKRYHDALQEYYKLQDRVLQPQNMLMQITIRKQMSDWDYVMKLCTSQASKNPAYKQKFAELAVEASINLGKWDQVRTWLQSMAPNHQKINLWHTMLKIHQKKYNQAQIYINKDRHSVYSKISQLFNFSFQRIMQGVIRLQQLCQLQQATAYLKILQPSNHSQQVDKKAKLICSEHRKRIQNLWNDRIEGSKKSLNAMQVLLMTRNLLLTKTQDINNWIDYCHLALKQNQTELAKKTLRLLEQQLEQSNDVKKKFQIQTLLIETKFILGQLKDQQAVSLIQKNIDQKGNTKSDQSICRLYFNCAMWLSQKQYDFTVQKGHKCIQMLKKTTNKVKNFIKGWHLMGLMHLKIDQLLRQKKKVQKKVRSLQQQEADTSVIKQIRQTHIYNALHSFIKSVSCGVKNHGFFLQDCLKIMNILFNESQIGGLVQQLQRTYTEIPSQGLIDIIPQIIGRLDIVEKPKLLDMMKKLLIHIGQNHPQALVFYLIFLKNCQNKARENIAGDIMKQISKIKGQSFNSLCYEAQVIVHQLCKVSLKLNERFKISMQKLLQQSKMRDSKIIASKYLKVCDKFKKQLQKQKQKQRQKKQMNQNFSISQFGFLQQYKQQISDIINCLQIYQRFNQHEFFRKAERIINKMTLQLDQCLRSIKKISLQQTSPQLMKMKNTSVCIPGSYMPFGDKILIESFYNELDVISSKQRPKKLIILGSDSKQYLFLLKGKEDLRLDQRIMQLFNLINKMFHDPVERQNYQIKGYSITPISLQTGLIQWVQNCDTIADLIMDHRKNTLGPNKILLQREISARICQNYLILPKAHKVQIYKQIQSRVSGNDLKNIFWIRSSNSQEWLKNRSCYTRSLAVMSIVGFVIGLGDRHPYNIMIQRNTGKVVHIDFGDCFDVNKTRGQFPQKVPFRLTRMLVKNMQPCGIHGIFKHTCQKIMKMLRNNKQSIIAIIEAFRYDPIIGWRLKGNKDEQKMLENSYQNNQTQQSYFEDEKQKDKEGDSKNKILGNSGNIDTAQHILNQIKKKLGGKSTEQTNKVMSPHEQVNELIKQAISPENLVQHFEGWSIYW